MKNSAFLNLSAAGLIWAASASAVEQTQKCQITFPNGSAKVDQNALSTCVKILKLQSGDKITVDAYASTDGNKASNKKLSQKRANSVAGALKKQVEGVDVKVRGLGERGAEGRVALLVTEKPQPQKTEADGTKVAALDGSNVGLVKEAGGPSPLQGHWRVAARGGIDSARIENHDHYFATGIDLAFIPETENENLRIEIGALAHLYTENENNQMSSLHLAPMVGYQSGHYIAGLRGLAGLLHSNETDKDYTDAGAELRLGYEKNNLSFFIGAGRTNNLDRIGMDLGARF